MVFVSHRTQQLRHSTDMMKATIQISAGLHARLKSHVALETLKPGKEKLKVFEFVEAAIEKAIAPKPEKAPRGKPSPAA